MKPLNRPLVASMFCLGKAGYSATEAPLPSDALVIVIQDPVAQGRVIPDRSGIKEAPSLLEWRNRHCAERESLPVIRRKAEKAYARHSKSGIAKDKVSG